jgi:hypothetical protein
MFSPILIKIKNTVRHIFKCCLVGPRIALFNVVEVLDFLMGCEPYLRKRRISVSSRRYKHRHRQSKQCSSEICRVVVDVFSSHLLVYRSAFAQRFSRSQPTRESNTSTTIDTGGIFEHKLLHSLI